MKFIHAVIFDNDEMKYNDYDTGSWDDLCDGDYVVHCLYCVDTNEMIIHDDNTHEPVEAMIDSFIKGVNYMCDCAIVEKALVVVDNGFAYNSNAVILRISEGNYTEVND